MSTRRGLEERVERERQAHADADILAANVRLRDRFPHQQGYPSKRRLGASLESYVKDLAGKTILDYGCGRGVVSVDYLQNGAERVYGIDISPVYIEEAKRAARDAGYPASRFDFQVMDAHDLRFGAGTFDLVVGRGILHHLQPDVALSEVHRVLKPGGRALFWEPLADNPLLKLFRWLTPHARTKDEAPFSGRQIRELRRSSCWQTQVIYCGLIEAPVAVLTSLLMPQRPDNALLRGADRLERWTHAHQFLLSWNQHALFNLLKRA